MEEELFSVGDFAKISRTSESTLRHYDKIGLLEPIFRKENNYRRYSIRQLAALNMIRTLQKLGIPLAEIKGMRDRRTPALAKEILTRQVEELEAGAADIEHAKRLLLTLLHSIQSGLDAEKDSISVRFMPEEPVIFGDRNDYGNGRNDYDALFDFYESMMGRYSGWDLSYPVWGVFSPEQVRSGDWKWPSRYYFYNPTGPDRKPAAFYAVGYTNAGYGMGHELFQRMLEYTALHGFEICGDTYVEYPFNEICTDDDKNYLMRLMITVRERIQGKPYSL